MSHAWQIVDSGCLSAEVVMAKDSQLLQEIKAEDPPILHLYEWAIPCLTYGYFMDPYLHLHQDILMQKGIQLARRPTGGGIIFHLTDLAFSLVIPAHHPSFSLNTLANYARINTSIAQAISQWTAQRLQPLLWEAPSCCATSPRESFCMAKPTPYDLIVNDQKIGGAAQRRMRQGFLHQGSVAVGRLPFKLLKEVLKEEAVILAMQNSSTSIFPQELNEWELQQARKELREVLKNQLTENYDFTSTCKIS